MACKTYKNDTRWSEGTPAIPPIHFYYMFYANLKWNYPHTAFNWISSNEQRTV